MEQICNDCGLTKDINYFYYDKRRHYRFLRCKSCGRKAQKSRYASNELIRLESRKRVLAQRLKVKSDPVKHKADLERRSLRSKTPKYREKRKVMMSRLMSDASVRLRYKNTARAWYILHKDDPVRKEARRKYMSVYQKNRMANEADFRARRVHDAVLRRHRAKGLTCSLTKEEWTAVVAFQDGVCAKCGRLFSGKLPPTKDHIVPVSFGGGLCLENVQALCRKCNSSKQDSFADYREDWHREMIMYATGRIKPPVNIEVV